MYMLEYFIELEKAIVSGNYPRIAVIYFSALLVATIAYWKDLSLPRYRFKFFMFSLLSVIALTLWAFGLLAWPTSGLVLLLLAALAAVFVHSSRGKLLWPCSSILCDVSAHIKANKPEKAEEMLRQRSRCFLDPTEKYPIGVRLRLQSPIFTHSSK
jgi:hypothetical protein